MAKPGAAKRLKSVGDEMDDEESDVGALAAASTARASGPQLAAIQAPASAMAALKADLLAGMSSSIAASVASSVDSSFARMSAEFAGMLTGYDKTISAQFEHQEVLLRDISTRLAAVESSHVVSSLSLQRISVALAVVESSTPVPVFAADAFDRLPDVAVV